MAIDLNSIKLLLWSKNLGVKFERTATLGRLGFDCSPGKLRSLLGDFGIILADEPLARCFHREPCRDLFADGFLRALGAEECISIDRSNFEGASFLHDLNEPFPEKMRKHFDFVLDGGTLEHVFNYPAALKHSLELVRVGGYFLTMPPANGHMGHGFYQCSPELFFSIFGGQNGFVIKKIVIFETYRPDTEFFEVQSPVQLGGRVELSSSPAVSLAVLAQRTAEVPIFAEPPQQSDYVAAWKAADSALAPSTPVAQLRIAFNPYWPNWLRRFKRSLKVKFSSPPNPHSLTNQRFFKPLSPGDMAGERGQD